MQRLSRRGDWPRAVALGKQAVDEFPENYLLQSILAAALLRFGKTVGLSKQDYQMALRYMKQAAELNPDYTPAVRNIKVLEKMIAKISEKA